MRGVDDAAHVAAVDAHAEGDGRDDDVELLGGERVLRAAALLGLHAGVVGRGAEPASWPAHAAISSVSRRD